MRRVFARRPLPVQHHPPRDAAAQGARLVVGEIHARRPAHDFHDAAIARRRRVVLRVRLRRGVGMLRDARQLLRDLRWRQHEIHAPRRDRTARHRIVLRALVLRESDTARRLDFLQPDGAIAHPTREHHADGQMRRVFRQRAEKKIDPAMRRMTLLREQPQLATVHPHVPPRRDDIDPIALQLRFIAHLAHRHLRGPREDFREAALMIRREMLHDDESHPHRLRQRAEHFPQRLHAARRSADAHHGKRCARLLR